MTGRESEVKKKLTERQVFVLDSLRQARVFVAFAVLLYIGYSVGEQWPRSETLWIIVLGGLSWVALAFLHVHLEVRWTYNWDCVAGRHRWDYDGPIRCTECGLLEKDRES